MADRAWKTKACGIGSCATVQFAGMPRENSMVGLLRRSLNARDLGEAAAVGIATLSAAIFLTIQGQIRAAFTITIAVCTILVVAVSIRVAIRRAQVGR